MNLQKKTIHIISLQRKKEKIPRTMVSHLEQVKQNGPMKLRSDFRAAVSIKKIVHTASQAKKLKSVFLQNNTRDGISLQAHRGGTSLNGIGHELIRIDFFFFF